MRICVIGTGYVGLVTGTCFADMGNNVYCVDIDEQKITCLQAGDLPFYEPGLKELMAKNTAAGRLSFTSDIETGLSNALLCFIAVGTPPNEDGSSDLSQVLNAAKSIGKYARQYIVVVNKSTVPIGTADRVRNIIQQQLNSRALPPVEFDVVSNPEFLREGSAINDFLYPDRVIIGAANVRSAQLLRQLYLPLVRNEKPLLIMDSRSAEMAKYASNAMLALRISFINELARLCDAVGADIDLVREGMGTDPRIGLAFLNAGIGYGGSCLPKDLRHLIATGRQNKLHLNLIEDVERINEHQKHYPLRLLEEHWGDDWSSKIAAVWGLSFKPLTDDMREAPSVTVIKELVRRGAAVQAYDPEAMEQAKKVFVKHDNGFHYVNDNMEAIDGAHALLLLTEWPQFQQPDFEQIKQRMSTPLIIDGRNLYDPRQMKKLGFQYFCVGRNCYV